MAQYEKKIRIGSILREQRYDLLDSVGKDNESSNQQERKHGPVDRTSFEIDLAQSLPLGIPAIRMPATTGKQGVSS